MSLNASFPNLAKEGFEITSPVDGKYNCIAFAADDLKRFWWPVNGYWPPNVTRSVSCPAFSEAYATLGYESSQDGAPEKGYDKIAVYTIDGLITGKPTHAAKLAKDGRW